MADRKEPCAGCGKIIDRRRDGHGWSPTKGLLCVSCWEGEHATFKDPTIKSMVDAVDNPKKVNIEPINKDHAEKGRMALLGAGFDIHPDELATSIYDLVADLFHLARENDIEPDYIVHMAQTHFDAEVEEESLNPFGEE